MNTLKEYEVLRLIEHNRICYVSSDIVKGWPLVRWIRFHPYLSKEQIIRWIHDIIKQLVQIHKCRGNPSYQYVNPYSLIVTDDEEICFLNMKADSNRDRIQMMQRRNIREYFLPEGFSYLDAEEKLDIYGLGKTIQYLLAFAEIKPGFRRREEKKFRKMIDRCVNIDSKKSLVRLIDVQKWITTF